MLFLKFGFVVGFFCGVGFILKLFGFRDYGLKRKFFRKLSCEGGKEDF